MAVPDAFAVRLAETLARAYAQRADQALLAFAETHDTVDLDEALNHARAAVAALVEARGYAPCDVAGARELTAALPAVARLAEVCARHAEHVMATGVAGLWRRLGLAVVPALWSAEDRRLAEGLLALALVSPPEAAERLMSAGLRRIAAGRLADALLAATTSEPAFAAALGPERHAALVRRYGPSLIAPTAVREHLRRTLTAWFADGAVRARLPDALEAAVVHGLEPTREA